MLADAHAASRCDAAHLLVRGATIDTDRIDQRMNAACPA